jgi:hypothetical protein
MFVDRLLHLTTTEFDEVLGTEIGVVSRKIDDGRPPARSTLHDSASGHDRADLDDGICVEQSVSRNQRAVADDEMGFS